MTVVSESLVDAKEEARQAEARVDIAESVNAIERRMIQIAFWIIGFNLAMAGLIIAVLR